MYCTKCGKPMPDDADFCAACGQRAFRVEGGEEEAACEPGGNGSQDDTSLREGLLSSGDSLSPNETSFRGGAEALPSEEIPPQDKATFLDEATSGKVASGDVKAPRLSRKAKIGIAVGIAAVAAIAVIVAAVMMLRPSSPALVDDQVKSDVESQDWNANGVLTTSQGGADKKLDTPVSGLESACTRWRPGSSPWRPSRRGSA